MITPIETNARKLVGVLLDHFPTGGSNCADLCRKFQEIANRKHATFFDCLRFAKAKGWIVADGRIYVLSRDGRWRDALKPPPIGEGAEHILAARMERIEKLEAANRRLRSSQKAIVAGETAPAIAALMAIMSDSAVSIAKRISAAQSLLEYKSPPDVANGAKAFLASVFSDPEMNVDHRLAATTALRRSEDPRVVPATERPPPPVRTDSAAEPPIPLLELVRQRRERSDRMQREMALQLEADLALNRRGD